MNRMKNQIENSTSRKDKQIKLTNLESNRTVDGIK